MNEHDSTEVPNEGVERALTKTPPMETGDLALFAARIGNELNNPLSAVLSAHQYIRQRIESAADLAADPRIARFFDIIESELANASRVAGDLVDFGTVRPVIRTSFVLRDLVEDAFKRVRNPEHVAMENLTNDDLVHLDRDKCRNALTRIVQNAVEAIPNGRAGRVVVTGKLDGAQVSITVKDDGVGLGADVVERVGEPLFSTKIKGTGLGLSIAEALIEAQSGEIRVESEAGGGASFILTIRSQ